MLMLPATVTTPAPAIIAPAPTHQGDQFPGNRCAPGRHGGQKCTPAVPQLRAYWIDLARPTVDPEHGPMLESLTIDAEIIAGYIPGQGGEVKRLTALVAAEMPGWTITGLSLADDPDTEF
jgi:hypothetical protein